MVNKIKGTTGDDVLIGTANVDYIETLTGNDTVSAGGGDDIIWVEAGAKTIDGGDNVDTIVFSNLPTSGAGVIIDLAKTINGIYTITNVESLVGTQGVDQLWGTEGANFLDGDAGSDHLYGRGGNDTFRDLVGQNEIDGGTGTDTLRFDQAAAGWTIDLSTGRCVDKVSPGNQNIVKSIEVVYGGSYADMFTASSGADTFYGQDGNDTFVGIGKGDFVNGGAGIDTVDFSASSAGTIVSLTGSNTSSIETVVGSRFNDYITARDIAIQTQGSSNQYSVFGEGGDDILDIRGMANSYASGGDGDDMLRSGLHSTLHGGNGADKFVFDSSADMLARITDFRSGIDKIYLSSTDFRLDNTGHTIWGLYGGQIDLGASTAVSSDITYL